jgi:hypothetical protein
MKVKHEKRDGAPGSCEGTTRRRHQIPPHYVDLVPPLEGFADSVEEEIIQFLERRSGTFDLYGEIANSDAFIRYCFEQVAEAEAFHGQFALAAEKAIACTVTEASRRHQR